MRRAKANVITEKKQQDGENQMISVDEALVKMLEPFGIREMVQSGLVAVSRGARSINGPDRSLRSVDRVERMA